MPENTQVATLTAFRDGDAARRARGWRRIGLALLGLVLVLGAAGLLGIRSTTETARSPEGYQLEVTHAQVTRAGLAVPFHVTVRHPGGFDGPVTLSISSSLPERFDFQNFYPNPAKETATEGRLVYEFDPPPGDVFRLSLDARTAPDQNGSADTYRTALVIEGQQVAKVGFRMVVVP
ncbi:MAG: hypothetical protein LH461_05630 [Spirochaetaceae bacterium]|nr:hypothetical protein [Spirochaetaceae bacterium]